MIERVGSHGGRDLFLARIDAVEAWPDALEEPERHFVAFLALDATGVASEQLDELARKLIGQRAVFVCAWGPDCVRVHDRFDRVVAERLPEAAEGVDVTTWHAEETIDQALWFALFTACPHDEYVATCDAVLAIVVANDEWARQVRGRLSDPDGLTADVAF